MRNVALSAFVGCAISGVFAVGCGDSGNTSANTGGDSTSTTSATGGSGTTSAGGGGGTSSGGGGTGGTTATGGSGGSTTSMTTTTSMTGTGGGMVGGHLLINEIAVAPEGGAEFIEIHNPTDADVALKDYYLSDNSTYVDIASGKAWTPITNNPGTDFLARFPANAVIAAGGYKVIATDPGYEVQYAGCPDFFLEDAPVTCGGGSVPDMLLTEAGSFTAASNLSNMREMVVLFTWSGDVSDLLADADYVTWGATFEMGTRADKTAVSGYKPDTAPDLQKGAPIPGALQSIERCGPEVGEKQTGGNGISGHDETSEDLGASFKVTSNPTPGKANVCQ